MLKKSKTKLALVAAVLGLGGVWLVAGGSPDNQKQRDLWTKTFQAGNFKDAFEGLKKMCLDPKNDPMQVGKDMQLAVEALRKLGRVDEADDFRESVIKVHAKNWRLLAAAAESYANQQEHHGFIVAGKFYRGTKRGGARYVNTMLRDRARALQLMDEGHKLMANENDKLAAADFYMQYARHLMYAGQHEPWRLQYLTDLSKLPDYEEGYVYRRGFGGNHHGAPVDADGNPVYHRLAKSYDTAESDGQRWRWTLKRATDLDPTKLNEADEWFANFHKEQFGVQTMAFFGFRFGQDEERDGDQKTGTFALHTLKDTETIARLATGIKRFTVPDEFNYIKVYERIIGRGRSAQAENSYGHLSQEYEDRRQYVRAAEKWKEFIQTYGAGNNNYRQQRLDQIVKNWGRFEPNNMQAAGTKANVEYRFRNGNKVSFEAHAIKVGKLLEDVKAYLKANPNRIDWNEIQIGNIGHRLVVQNQNQYLGEKVATWDLDVKPRAEHVDSRVTVTTPLSKAGAYLVTAKMADGNESRIIIWNTDTIILKKQLDNQTLYYTADAATGTPVSGAQLDFFGWKQEQVKPNVNQFRIDTLQFNTTADNDGQVITGDAQQPNRYQWLITAKAAKNAQEDRFAYLGFTNVWYGRRYDPEYNQTKVFTITDRPVYRPEQTANFKVWVEHAKYDEPNTSAFAGKTFIVQIHNPKAEKVYEKSLTADEYGGISGDYLIPKSATLGIYGVQILQNPNQPIGHSNFRVEEYKKPEFEVTVEAPKEPVRLGEKIEATINAKYYFGAPVVNAKVKYKVMRQEHTARWFPRGDWDWMYGRGYWWFSPDFVWYPGFNDWGCCRPMPWWWHRNQTPPEMVMEQEVEIGPDGIVKVEIDTGIAKELHGNQDHKYSITAEVTDQSRRTIVGEGDVLVARKPFQVHAWLNRGHFRSGDTVTAYFNAQTLDQKPVEGKGELTLFAISYNDKNQPVEKAVETWKLDTDVEGKARQQVKAAKAGQYRLSYKVTDAKKHTIEGGYLFMVRGDAFTGKDFRFNDIEIVADKREYQPGENVKLMLNTNQNNGTILLFARPSGVYQAPKVIRLDGKSTEQEIAVVQRDMPNFFVEAVTIHGGRVHSEMREIIVPPEKRVLNVEVEPSQQEYKPGQKATVTVKLTDLNGKPFIGSTVVSIYDKSVEYISGGSNVPEIKEFFWKWRRHHQPQTESSLMHAFHQLLRQNEIGMSNLGVFGEMVIEEMAKNGMMLGEAKGGRRFAAAAAK